MAGQWKIKKPVAPSSDLFSPDVASAPTAFRATVKRVTFHNPDNAYGVVRLLPEHPRDLPAWCYGSGGAVTAVGTMPGVEVGQHVEVEGEWVREEQYGWQCRLKVFKPSLPSSAQGIELYLASGAVPGIGPVMAERIVNKFGEQTLDVLDTQIERLRSVPGVGAKTFEKIAQGWREARGGRELLLFLAEHEIRPSVAARLQKAYGENALAVVRANPYRLATEVRGVGFARADAIARKLGLPHDAPERIDAGLRHTLDRAASDGHTCQLQETLIVQASELLELDETLLPPRLGELLKVGKLTLIPAADDNAFVALPTLFDAERRIADRLALRARHAPRVPKLDLIAELADFEQRSRFELAERQREATLKIAREGEMILTGGPGTGKTTTVQAILALFERGKRSVKLAAPTGRAARRLAETTGRSAETVHRLLNFQPPLGQFARDKDNPIEADLVIVDEASMLDAPLAAALLDAVAPTTCLLLVGDEDQLPSVGPGNVLGDLIASGAIALVRLDQVFRQASRSLIVTNAHRINHGQMPLFEPPTPEDEADFFFIERDEPEQVVEVIATMCAERIPRRFGLNPLSEIQVLTPMRRGPLGVEALNEHLQALLNPPEEQSNEQRSHSLMQLNPGDRVIQTQNDYDKLVYNGDVGRVRSVDPKDGKLVIDFEGRQVTYLDDERDTLSLAFAVTIHKSQGSEYPAVVIPLHTQHWVMLQRNLLYTALTRGRKLVCIVGSRKALRQAVGNAARGKRMTALPMLIDQQREEQGQA